MKNLILFLIFSISFTPILPARSIDCNQRKRPYKCLKVVLPSPSPSPSLSVSPSPSVVISESLEVNPE